jgi:non-ribosomal peptide synthase protein (TIGR01720 family)
VQSHREYWTGLVTAPAGRLPVDGSAPADADTVATARNVTTSLDAAETEELLRLPDTLNCAMPELLLAALGRTLSSWTGNDRHIVDLVRHDREQLFDEVDLARTVGAFGHVHPVALACGADGPPEAAVREVKEQLRSIPSGGIGWQLLRQDTDPVPAAPVDLAFTYLAAEHRPEAGSFTVTDSPGDDESPRNLRPYPVEVCASAAGGELTVRWTYSETRYQHETITRAAERYAGELRTMIELGRGAAGPVHTPSDFPLAHVDQTQLDALLSRL